MNALSADVARVVLHVVETSWQAAVLAVVVVALGLLLRERLSARWRCALWLVVVVRLLMPVAPESPVSLFNLFAVDFASADAGDEAGEPASPAPVPAVDPMLAQRLVRQPMPVVVDELPMPVEPTEAPAVAPSPPWYTTGRLWLVLGAVWLSGATVVGARLLLLMLRLRLLLSRANAVSDPDVLRAFEEARRELGVRRHVGLVASTSPVGPAVTGIIAPKMILSESLLRSLSIDELRLVFLHELSHVRRQDLVVQQLWMLAEVLHWFNPAVWLSARRWQAERELACDEAVLARLDRPNQAGYGHAILRVMESLSTLRPVPGAVGVVTRRGVVARRIAKIARYRPLARRWTALAAGLLFVLIPMGLTNAVGGSKTSGEIAGRAGDSLAVTSEQGSSDVENHESADTKGAPAQGRRDVDSKSATTAVTESHTVFGGATLTLSGGSTSESSDDGDRNAQVTLVGRCVDTKGEAVPGAEVKVFETGGGPHRLVTTLATDEKGRFQFGPAPAPFFDRQTNKFRSYIFSASKAGLALTDHMYHAHHAGQKEIVVMMRPAASLSGRVTDVAGKPIEGASVSCMSGEMAQPERLSTMTNAEGRFEVKGLPAGTPPDEYMVWHYAGINVDDPTAEGQLAFMVRRPGYACASVVVEQLPAKVDVKLQPEAVIEGRVIDSVTDKPAAGIVVSAQPKRTTAGFVFQRSTTNEQGRYRITGLAAGDHYLAPQAKDRLQMAVPIHVTAGKTEKAPDLKLIEGGIIEGRVIDSVTGKPIAEGRFGAPLTVIEHGKPHEGVYADSSRVDASGRFRLRVPSGKAHPYLLGGELWRRVEGRERFSKQGIDVRDGETTQIEFRVLPPEAAPKTIVIGGRCVDENGEPIEGATVLLGKLAWKEREYRTQLETTTDQKGRFQFEPVPTPKQDAQTREFLIYAVVATKPGRATATRELYPSGIEDSENLTFEMLPAASLRGRITDPAGGPIAGASVLATIPLNNRYPGVRMARTDADGQYEIADLTPWPLPATLNMSGSGVLVVSGYSTGGYGSLRMDPNNVPGPGKFRVVHPDYATGLIKVKRIPATADATLTPGGVVEGRLLDADSGKPLAGVHVSLYTSGKGSVYRSASGTTGADGRFRVQRLTADKYHVMAVPEDRPNAKIGVVDVEPGKTAKMPEAALRHGGVIKGRVIDAATGKPIASGRYEMPIHVCTVESSDEIRPQYCDADADGRFTLYVRPGKTRLVMSDPDMWNRTQQHKQLETEGIEVKQGETVTIELRVQPNAAKSNETSGTTLSIEPSGSETIAASDGKLAVISRHDESHVKAPNELEFRVLANKSDHRDLAARAERDKSVVRDDDGRMLARWVPVTPGHEKECLADRQVVKRRTDNGGHEVLAIADTFDVTDRYATRGRVTKNDRGDRSIVYTMTTEGDRRLVELAMANLPDESGKSRRMMGIIFGGKLYSVLPINEDMVGRAKSDGRHGTTRLELMMGTEEPAKLEPPKTPETSMDPTPRPVAKERAAVAAIRRLGGRCAFDRDGYVKKVDMSGAWIRVPVDARHSEKAIEALAQLSRLRSLELRGADTRDEALKEIARLSKLRGLKIRGEGSAHDANRSGGPSRPIGQGVTDEGVAYLAGHPALQFVFITDAGLTDRSLKTFATIPKLRWLSLQGNHFTDDGLAHLAGMVQLRQLIIDQGGTHISDAGVAHLARLKNLESLWLQGCTLTDRGLRHILGARNMRTLELAGANLTDTGVAQLVEAFPGVVHLSFDCTNVTDRGIDELYRLGKLNCLTLGGAEHISKAAFDRLKAANRNHVSLHFADEGRRIPGKHVDSYKG